MKVWQLFENFGLSELNANFAELLASISGTKATYLTANKTVYVATTGSDTTGDGTSGKPYRTITKGLSVIPKNLNGFDGTISIAGGTYAEDVNIIGFTNGLISVLIGGNITINKLNIYECTYMFVGIQSAPSTITLSSSSSTVLLVNRNSGVNIQSSVSIVTTSTSANPCVNTAGGSNLMIGGSLTVNNATVAIQTNFCSKTYIATLAGTGNGTAIKGDSGGIISYTTKTISATTDHLLSGGAIITNLITMP